MIVLTGFLGSGKTTLLNRLLLDPAWSDSAVIVNEFGDIGLDHLLVSNARDNIVLMDAGCLCCTVLDSLPQTLADLFHRRAGGDIPAFRRVLVETSGLAEPAPILRTLMRDPIISHFYRPQGLICTVDALFGSATLDREHEAPLQAAMADRIVVTKTDLAVQEQTAALIARLRALNPAAEIVLARDRNAACLFAPETNTLPWLDPLKVETADHHHHDDGAVSVSFLVGPPLSWARLAAWIERLRARYGPDLLRAKGVLNVAGAPVALHGVQTQFDTRRLPDWPDDDRRSRIVLIGRGLDGDEAARSISDLTDGTDP